ncbi:hypothetical protein GCM10023170_075950 [Phytohabitans houttuyneae]
MTTLTEPSTPAAHRSSRRMWAILGLVLLADALDVIDATVTNIAAPTIASELDGGESLIKWLGPAYMLAMGVLLVVGGRLGDKFGQRRLFRERRGEGWCPRRSRSPLTSSAMRVILLAQHIERCFGLPADRTGVPAPVCRRSMPHAKIPDPRTPTTKPVSAHQPQARRRRSATPRPNTAPATPPVAGEPRASPAVSRRLATAAHSAT